MELIGLTLFVPLTLITSGVYTALAFAMFSHWPGTKKFAIPISYAVTVSIGLEVLLLAFIGAKGTFADFDAFYSLIHLINLVFGPPALANIVLHFTTRAIRIRFLPFAISATCCWFACMAAVFGNVVVDEAIGGIKSGHPFWDQRSSPGNPLAPSKGDWRYSDLISAIDTFRKLDPATAAKLPQAVRSIYVKGPDTLSVYLGDPSGYKHAGCELTLKRSTFGIWAVAGSRFFEY